MISAILCILALVLTIPFLLFILNAVKKGVSFILGPGRYFSRLKPLLESVPVNKLSYIWILGAVISIGFLLYGLSYKWLGTKPTPSEKREVQEAKLKYKKEMDSFRKRKQKLRNSSPLSPSPLIQF